MDKKIKKQVTQRHKREDVVENCSTKEKHFHFQKEVFLIISSLLKHFQDIGFYDSPQPFFLASNSDCLVYGFVLQYSYVQR